MINWVRVWSLLPVWAPGIQPAAAHLHRWTYFFMRNLLMAFCFLMNWTISLFR